MVFLYFSVVISSRFDSIRFEVLAKPMGVSELSALIPKELQVRETQLSEALDQVATPGNPDSNLSQVKVTYLRVLKNFVDWEIRILIVSVSSKVE